MGDLKNWFYFWISVNKHWRHPKVIWAYPPIEDSLNVEGLGNVEEYITWWKNTTIQCIMTLTIYKICVGTENMAVLKDMMLWWEHVGIDFEGDREMGEAED